MNDKGTEKSYFILACTTYTKSNNCTMCVMISQIQKKKKLENSSLIPGQSVECNIGMFLHYSLEIVSPFPLRTRSEIVFHNFFFPQYEIALFVIDIRTTHIGYFFLNNFGPIVFFDLLFA